MIYKENQQANSQPEPERDLIHEPPIEEPSNQNSQLKLDGTEELIQNIRITAFLIESTNLVRKYGRRFHHSKF